MNIYQQIASNNALLNLPMVQEKIYGFADLGIEKLTNLLFGTTKETSIEEAAEIAKMVSNSKIEEYRSKILAEQSKQSN